MDIEIIEAKGSDIQAAAELALKIWEPMREVFKAELGEEIYQTFFKDWRDEKKKAVTEELSSGKGYVAKHASRIVGFISYGTNGNTGVILTNGVDSEYRGHGIGGMLYNHVFDRMRNEGVEYVKVHTGGDDGHKPARRAYEKAGFDKRLLNVVYYKKL